MKFPQAGALAVVSISVAIFLGLLQKYALSTALLGSIAVVAVGEMAVFLYWLHKRIDAAEIDHANLKKHNPSLYKEPLSRSP